MSEEAVLRQQIIDLIARIEAKTEELRAAIDTKIGWLPGRLQDQVVRGWNSFTAAMSDQGEFLREVVENMGSPSILWSTANAWSDRIGGPVSGQSQLVLAGALTMDDQWEGQAADAYRQTLPLQSAALDKVRSALCEGASTVLSGLGWAIFVFWAAVVGALLALIGGILGALTSTATIVGIPAAPFIAAAAAAVAGGAIGAAVLNLEGKANDANATLRQKLADNSAFGEGHWPVSVLAG